MLGISDRPLRIIAPDPQERNRRVLGSENGSVVNQRAAKSAVKQYYVSQKQRIAR